MSGWCIRSHWLKTNWYLCPIFEMNHAIIAAADHTRCRLCVDAWICDSATMALCSIGPDRSPQLKYGDFYIVLHRVLDFLIILISKVHCMCAYTCRTDATDASQASETQSAPRGSMTARQLLHCAGDRSCCCCYLTWGHRNQELITDSSLFLFVETRRLDMLLGNIMTETLVQGQCIEGWLVTMETQLGGGLTQLQNSEQCQVTRSFKRPYLEWKRYVIVAW